MDINNNNKMNIDNKTTIDNRVNVGFIGTGKMGSAIIKGLIKSGTIQSENIYIYDIDKAKTARLKNEFGINVQENNEQVITMSNIIILAVLPNKIRTVLEPCKHLFENKILVSIAAGVPIKTYEEILGTRAKIVRTMPNRPAEVFEGMTLISYKYGNLNIDEIELIKCLFRSVGEVEELDENLMDGVVSLTSSSPAYVFMLIESMTDAGVLNGIPRSQACKMAAQAVLGSAKMILKTGRHPAELRDEICTPGGTTIEAVKSLEENCFRYTIMEAMVKCTEKAKKIGENYK